MKKRKFDRSAEDLGNCVGLEHMNVAVPDQRLATLFYIMGLGFTRDPYLVTGVVNMWVNMGRSQFHLPIGDPQVVRGRTGIVVPSLDEAIAHVNRFSSGHTEAILTDDLAAARRFTHEVDSGTVVVNASTRFTDGAEFGFGAEIGISTQKLHARGPMALRELTTYKYVVWGDGQIRN